MLTDDQGDVGAETVLGVAEGLDLVLLSDDELLVQFGTRSRPSELLRDSDLTGILGQIVGRLLQGPARVEDVLSTIPAVHHPDARIAINDLICGGILTDVSRDPVEQFLRYTFAGHSELSSANVTLIGAGPLGARIGHDLLQHGIHQLQLFDERKVDPLWRKFMPGGVDASAPDGLAHEALRDWLLRAGHDNVTCLDGRGCAGLDAAVSSAQIVVVASEQMDIGLGYRVNRLAVREQRPWMLATLDGGLGLVGPLFRPPETACYNDFRVLAQAATPSPAMARKHRQHLLRRGRGSFFPGLPAYAEIVAGHASLAVVHFLVRGASFALGRVMVIDFDRMRIDVEDVFKLPRCPVCGSRHAAYRPPFPAAEVESV